MAASRSVRLVELVDLVGLADFRGRRKPGGDTCCFATSFERWSLLASQMIRLIFFWELGLGVPDMVANLAPLTESDLELRLFYIRG